MTIIEVYYAMNSAINVALKQLNVVAPVYKYGTVPNGTSYPYFQSSYRVQNRQPYASKTSGVLVDFEYVLNFFTAAGSDEENDAVLFEPYEIARELITSPDSFIWDGIANILDHNETPQFNFKGGLEVLQRGLIFDCQTVTSFVSSIHGGEVVTVDHVTETIKSSLNEG